jgi:type I restriction enzyme S subunit
MNAIHQLLTDHIDIWTAADTEKKSGRGRSSGNAASIYGIKKLRELILELAVRGKLVPQDPNDEPASELLKRIQAEKAQLIAEGKIKKDKSLGEITEEAKPFELPDGWAYSRLGDVVEIIRGITFPGSEKTKVPEKGRVACLRTTNVQDQIEWDDLLYIREEFVSREDQILMPRDIVMSMANSRELVGKVALVGTEIHQKTSFGGFLGVLRPFLIEPRFVMALLRTPHTREVLIDSASQTTNIANISLAKLRPLFFAIPPLPEQHRIVAKVDELMTLCDQLETQHSNAAEAHEKLVSHLLGTLMQSQSAEDFSANWQRIAAHFDTLFTTGASIDALKQTLLQLAVMGKLVSQDPSDEPASELLKRKEAIAEEKLPFQIPDSWSWARVDEIAQTRLGKMLDKVKNKGTPARYLRNINVRWFDFDLSDVKEMRFEVSELEEFALRCGDVLICEGGYPGRAAVWDERETNIYFQKAIHRVRFQNGINPYYFVNVLRESVDSGRLNSYFTGAGIQHFTGKGLMSFLVPLPPLAEQHRIVAKVDELMSICDQLKSRLTEASQLQQKLADVMVEQAVN